MMAQGRRDLPSDRQHRVERRRGVLKDHTHAPPAQPSQRALVGMGQLLPIKMDGPPRIRPGQGSKRMTEVAVTDLPDPLSPTMPKA